jgi:hypothetical protein
MLLCLLVLVRNWNVSFLGMTFFINSYENNMQEPVHVLVESIHTFFSKKYSINKSVLINYLFFFCDRFAETEAVAALSILISQYKLTVKEEPQFATETFEERKTRVLAARAGLTTTWVFFSVDNLEVEITYFIFSSLTLP